MQVVLAHAKLIKPGWSPRLCYAFARAFWVKHWMLAKQWPCLKVLSVLLNKHFISFKWTKTTTDTMKQKTLDGWMDKEQKYRTE